MSPPVLDLRAATEALNLGFERVEGAAPAGWTARALGSEPTAMAAVSDETHGGAHALRLRTASREIRSVYATVDAAPFVGKRVRLRGWIKTDGARDGAALWARVEGSDAAFAFADTAERRVYDTAPWTSDGVELEIEVLPGAAKLYVGAMLLGGGTAWFDDLSLELLPSAVPASIALAGTVTDAAGAPVAGAEVALFGMYGDAAQHRRTDDAGRFRFDVAPGLEWGLSAHRARGGLVGASRMVTRYSGDVHDLRLTLGASGGVLVRGATGVRPARATVLEILPMGVYGAGEFAVPVAADGSFEAVLPPAPSYRVQVFGGVRGVEASFDRTGDLVDARFELLAGPPAEVVDYIGAHGIPLVGPDVGKGFDDLARFGALVGDARVVALGEATYGTRELLQLKHRLLAYLVAKHGFTLLAIEANQPECRAINDYVLHGKGSAREVLAGIDSWTWNTEEVLALIEWMRAWNADPAHPAKVQFAGYDAQLPTGAYASIAAYLARVAPRRAAKWLGEISTLGSRHAVEILDRDTGLEQSRVAHGLAALAAVFDRHRAAWIAATSGPMYAEARHDLVILQQVADLFSASLFVRSLGMIDRARADNLGWLLDQTGAKTVVWAHNYHVSIPPGGPHNVLTMGRLLRDRLGPGYLPIGLVVGEGSFHAFDFRLNPFQLRRFTLGPPPEAYASTAFARAGRPLLALDLRALPPRGPVRAWFAARHPVRDFLAGFRGESDDTSMQVLPELYDAVIYVDKTTPARLLPGPRHPL